MNISITPELEAFVQKKVASGMYNSASELIREALRLLAERDALQQKRMEAMDAFIQEGIDSAARGEFVDPEEVWEKLERIIEEAEKKHG